MFRKSLIVLATVVAAACTGSTGPTGPTGGVGPGGDAGPPGANGCPGLAPGQTAGLTATISVSSPPNGAAFFNTGDQPVLTITFANNCGQQLAPSDLASAELYVYGPRAATETVTNTDLLNVPYAVFNAYAPLMGLPDGGPSNLSVAADGTVTYTLSPINVVATGPIPPGQIPGTYTAGVWAQAPGPASNAANAIDQVFVLADFQIGTATAESFISGPANASTCLNCHGNHEPGGKVYINHIPPEPPRTNVGNYALDSLPIGSCKSCHNNQGYSPYTIMHKVHAAHRGEHQRAPSVPHPDYGYDSPDTSLLDYLNVGFPLMPLSGSNNPGITLTADSAMEKDCNACHINGEPDGGNVTLDPAKISRAACGSCHDNVFFAGAPLADGGVDPTGQNVIPPTNYGQPPTGPCTNTGECSVFPAGGNPNLSAAVCDTNTTSPTYQSCILTNHPIPSGPNPDAVCATCHAATTSSAPGLIAPVDSVHNITQWQPPITLDGYTFQNVTVTGASGGSGATAFFNVGDKPTLSFQLFDNTGAAVTNLATSSSWSGTFLVAGPTSNPQRVYGSATGGVSMKSATLGTFTYNATSQTYTYTPNATWPANALAPINTTLAPQPAPAGAYTVWFYWAHTDPTSGVRDAVDAQVVVPFGANQTPVSGRQVVTQQACASCHGADTTGGNFFPHLALHGDQRKNGETCNQCHSQFAQDNGVGSTGVVCTTNAQCGGYDSANPTASWEACEPNPAVTDGGQICTVTVDPTPGVEIDYQKLVHNIHFARLRAGFEEAGNLGEPWATPIPIPPGTLNYLGFQNGLSNFQQVLSPVDVRACTNCHQDSDATCSASAPCAFGQTCTSGKCTNNAWQSPTARACITCHDSADDVAHAALNTYTPPSGAPIESCNVCHGSGAEFAVDTVHNITTLYSLHIAYPWEP
ncbi:MAG: multiheme c-type cytochrome [Myxococcaceae bacterium]